MRKVRTAAVVKTLPAHDTGLSHDFHGRVVEFNDNVPEERVIFPVPEKYSPLLVNDPQTMFVVTGYDLTDNTEVGFYKISRSAGVPVQGDGGCCPQVRIGRGVTLRRVLLPCRKLDRCHPVFVIKTPGIYEVVVSGDTADVQLTAMRFPMQEVNSFAQVAPCDCGGKGERPKG